MSDLNTHEIGPRSVVAPESPSLVGRLARLLGLSVLAAGLLLAGATAGVTWWLWSVVKGAVLELAAGTGMNAHLREALLRLAQATVLVSAGFFLTFSIRRWQRGLFRMLLGLAAVPLLIWLAGMITGRDGAGLPLAHRQADPAAEAWFDPQTGAPRLWWAAGDDGAAQYFSRPGHHPSTGEALAPVTPAQRAAWLKECEEEAASDAARTAAAERQRLEAEAAARARAELDRAEADRRAAAQLREQAAREAAATRQRAAQEAEALRRAAAAEKEQASTERRRAALARDAARTAEEEAPVLVRAVPAVPVVPAVPSAPPPDNEYALRPGQTLNLDVHGDPVQLLCDGPAEVAADGFAWQRVSAGTGGIRFQGRHRMIRIRPLSAAATRVRVQRL